MRLLASERIGAARRWLGERSALGELLDVDSATMEPVRLYRASDAPMAHREAIERRLFDRAMDLFDLHPTVTLYDLTNTCFEGEAGLLPNARRGHSKDKRFDCPLLTLGLVLDASGFVRRSRVFAGDAPTARPCTCVKPPAPNPANRPSTRLWPSTPLREGPARRSPERPLSTRS